MRVLLVEDDTDVAGNVADFLEPRGLELDFAYDGQSAIRLLEEHVYDAMLLDINLPGLNGLQVCRHMRNVLNLSMPVLMLTARGELEDRLAGFEAGAWDYLVKPFALEELWARLQALSLRGGDNQAGILTAQGLEVSVQQCVAKYLGNDLGLHLTAITLLATLIKSAPAAVSYQELEYSVWGDNVPQSSPLKAHLYTLRKRLRCFPAAPTIITRKGFGYQLAIAEGAEES